MTNESFKDFFERLSRKAFNFLVEEYGYIFSGTQTPGFGALSTFQTPDVRIEVWWDIRDNYVDVLIFPLNSKDSGTNISKKEIHLDELLGSNAPKVKLIHKVPGDVLVEKPMEEILLGLSDALKEHGKELLREFR